MACDCNKLGKGVQTFRIADLPSKFTEIARLDPDYQNYMGARAVWRCNGCEQLFAFVTMPFKDEEDFVLKGPNSDWENWDWPAISNVAESVRYRGPGIDEFILWE